MSAKHTAAEKAARTWRIYVASSWRNPHQPAVVSALQAAGHKVYDFREPGPGQRGFHWSEIDPDWKAWTPTRFCELLSHPTAEAGFRLDKDALDWADAGVLVLPSGRSSHLEAGYLIGQGKPVLMLLADGEPELMYKLATGLCVRTEEALQFFANKDPAAIDAETKPLVDALADSRRFLPGGNRYYGPITVPRAFVAVAEAADAALAPFEEKGPKL